MRISLQVSHIVPLRHSVGEVVAPYDCELRAIKWYDVLGAIGRSHNLRRYQNHVDQLTQEHEAEREKLETSDAVIAQIEAVEAKHAEKNR